MSLVLVVGLLWVFVVVLFDFDGMFVDFIVVVVCCWLVWVVEWGIVLEWL